MNQNGRSPPVMRTSGPLPMLPMEPPVSIVVIRETPPRSQTNARSEQISSLPSTGRKIPFSSSPVSSAFRLQPRGNFATPSPSIRTRKRSAQCLAGSTSTTPQSYSLASRNLFSPETQNASQPIWEIPLPRTDIKMKYRSPCRVESALQTLSIKSPSTRSPVAVAGRPGSSFILYSSSPLGSSQTRPRANSTGSGVSTNKIFGSPSSTRSSQKFAPLTVLQNRNEESKIPTQRPPLHGRPSSLLISLDSTQSVDNDDVDLACGDEPVSGKQRDFSEQGKQSHTAHYSSPQRSFDKSSPSRRSRRSPSTPSSKMSSPRTPLPRVKLTPKSQSRWSSREGDEQDLGLLPTEFIIHGSSRPPLFNGERKSIHTDMPEFGFDQSNKSCALLEPMSPASPPLRNRSYLPLPEWGDNDATEPTIQPGLMPALCRPSTLVSHSMTSPAVREMVEESNVPIIETKSLLTPSRSRSLLTHTMMHEDAMAASMYDDGSLTDPDDDESFVLTNPALLVEEERQFQGRARQRQRLSIDSLDRSATRQSSTSLALSTPPSNTSLLGMAYMLQGDSSASLKSREMTPVSSLKFIAKEREHSLVENATKSADESKASINLCRELEDPTPESMEEAGWDLNTPPAVATTCSTPPLFLSLGEENAECTPSSSVYLSKADAGAVNMTISRMVFHANRDRSPR